MDFEKLRKEMVEYQLRTRGIKNEKIINPNKINRNGKNLKTKTNQCLLSKRITFSPVLFPLKLILSK